VRTLKRAARLTAENNDFDGTWTDLPLDRAGKCE
jgi:hypothetical protein